MEVSAPRLNISSQGGSCALTRLGADLMVSGCPESARQLGRQQSERPLFRGHQSLHLPH